MIKENLLRIIDSIESTKNKLGIKYNIDLMAVSKTKPIEDILEVINAGQKLFGENRVMEAVEKFGSDQLKDKNYSLHIIGHLQRNKAKKAVEIADMIQSIDKTETLDVLENTCRESNKIIEYLIEINTTKETQKYGINPENIDGFIDEIFKKNYNFCKLRGLMTVGPFTEDTELIRKSFRLLKKSYNTIKNELKNDNFNIISMGMSNDYDIAIEEASNLLRIGSSIFGLRDL